jgi:hypothetical protein
MMLPHSFPRQITVFGINPIVNTKFMSYLTFSKLKAYQKAEDFHQKIKELLCSIPRNEQNSLYSRITNNISKAPKYIKEAWLKGKNLNDFVMGMDRVILNNSEFESLIFEARINEFIDKKEHEYFLKKCHELRKVQLEMINNASLYFEKGRVPENWFGENE